MTDPETESLFKALEKQDLVGVRVAMDRGATAKCTLPGGKTALMHAAEGGFFSGLRALLATATLTDVLAQDNLGNTALIYAAQSDRATSVQLLIRRHAKLDHQSKLGQTALIRAVRHHRSKSISLLIRAGADLNIQDGFYHSALTCAVGEELLDVVRELIEGGCNVNTSDTSGLTPLMLAARVHAWPFVSALLDAGARVDALDKDGLDVVAWSAMDGNHKVLAHLLERGLKADRKSILGKTAEDRASDNTCRSILRAVREQGLLQAGTGADTDLRKRPAVKRAL